MELQSILEDIGDERRPLSYTRLYMLSHLSGEELQFFAKRWTAIGTTRRREILTALVELAEANITVDFGRIFRLGLRDEDGEVRAHAVDGLWEDDSPDLVDTFLEMLSSDPSIVARAAAATGLGRFVFMAELEELDEELGRKIVKALWRVIEDPTEALEPRRRAVEAIGFSCEEGVQGLIEEAYRNPVEKLRVSAVFSMGRSADRSWGPTVVGELGSTNPEMRFEAARACGELELREAVPSLITLIADSDREVQQAAISALGKIGGSEARSALRMCCESEDEAIAAAGDEALAELELTAGLFDVFLDDEEA
ncbi:MAG TPA: HEAT repeat domain-containing protein [Anaerolineae bacterium]|nr:HEAT repeat domain-containing protein [Anaerolineae bacterium]